MYFCYGCGAGGDAITFVMTQEHLSFVEAVERLAAKAGIQLRYTEAGPAPAAAQRGSAAAAGRARTPPRPSSTPSSSARPGPGWPGSSWPSAGSTRRPPRRYGCGFAPDGWDPLTKHLRQKGFTAPSW